MTAPIRAPFIRFEGASGHAEVAEEVREHGGVKHAVGELLTCPFCLAQWVGTGFVFGYVTAPKATRLAALTMTMVAGSDVLQFLYDGIQNGGLAPQTEGVDPARTEPVLRTGESATPLDLPPEPVRTYPVILTRSRVRRPGLGPVREGAACDRSGAGPCRSASSASA